MGLQLPGMPIKLAEHNRIQAIWVLQFRKIEGNESLLISWQEMDLIKYVGSWKVSKRAIMDWNIRHHHKYQECTPGQRYAKSFSPVPSAKEPLNCDR
jgi:hypothetical protein